VESLLIRKLDPALKTRLRVVAAQHGRSMEEEAREILKQALTKQEEPRLNLAESIRKRFAPFGGVEWEIPPREPMRPLPNFDE
jgi:plasmid stability protein